MTLSPEFMDGVLSLCYRVSLPNGGLADPRHFITCSAWESGLSPKALNKSSRAAGLIQWMPATLRGFGLTTEQVLAMPATRQLELCAQYFSPHRGKLRTAAAWYMAIFAPALIEHAGDPNFVVFAKNGPRSGWYPQNKGLDFNKDGAVTVEDMTSTLAANLTRYPGVLDAMRNHRPGVAGQRAMLATVDLSQPGAQATSLLSDARSRGILHLVEGLEFESAQWRQAAYWSLLFDKTPLGGDALEKLIQEYWNLF